MNFRSRLLSPCLFLFAAAPLVAQGWSTDSLSQGRRYISAISAGDELLFAGGMDSSFLTVSLVDIYDSSTGSWRTDFLSTPRESCGVTSVGQLAFFFGGLKRLGPFQGTLLHNTVDVYDGANGTWSVLTLNSVNADAAATSLGSKAYFAGGHGLNDFISDRVWIYETLADTWAYGQLSEPRTGMAATAVGTKVLFAGGWSNSGPSSRVDLYDAATDTWTTANLSQPRDGGMASATVGHYALFAGGHNFYASLRTVDIYDSAQETWHTAQLSVRRSECTAVTIGDKVYFSGGQPNSPLDVFDASTGTFSTITHTDFRNDVTSVAIGNRAFFTGEYDATVDIFTAATGGPHLSHDPIVAGSTAELRVSSATPGGRVLFAYSITGGGPIATAYGPLMLTAPFHPIGIVTADVQGIASYQLPTLFTLAGRAVWLQALDLLSGELSSAVGTMAE